MFATLLLAAALSQLSADEHQAAQPLLQFAQGTQAQSEHFAEVWPGFWSESTPFITFNDEGQAVLFTTEEALPGYQQLATNYYYYAQRLPNLADFRFRIHYSLPNDQVATAIRLSEGGAVNGDDSETLLHEAFHGYQRFHFDETGKLEFIEPGYLEDTTVRAMLQFQFALAQQAHESRELADVRDWLTVRVALNEAIAPEVSAYLKAQERHEGSAQWVGIKAAYADDYRGSIDDFFTHLPRHFETTHMLRSSAYVTGAVLIDLVAEFSGDDTDWRRAMEQGSSPIELALRTFEINTEEALADMEGVMSRHDFSQYMTLAQAAMSENLTLEEVEASHAYRLDITIELELKDGRADLPMRFAGGEYGFHQLEQNLIFLPLAETFQLDIKGSDIHVRDTPVLADLRKVQERQAVFSLWSNTPITTLTELQAMDDLQLNFNDSTIFLPAGWTLDEAATDAHIKVTF